MSEHPSVVEQWIAKQWAEQSARTLQSMTDMQPEANCHRVANGQRPEFEAGSLFVEVSFPSLSGAVLSLAVPPDSARALGVRTLEAAGIEDAGPEEIQNTCLEILQQAHAGLAQAISSRLKKAVASKGREADKFAVLGPIYRLEIVYPETPLIASFVSISPQLLASLDAPTETPSNAPVPVEDRANGQAITSKTFEVLLDVSMPVSVSFGRAELPIKEVLKLTTGSIIELDRSLTEPVDIIINDRVIARGDVVVVDGNYGVRIHQIISRQERFRTSSSGSAMISKGDI